MIPISLLSGRVLGGMLLVAGSCIGAGMLAMPILTGLAGFFPSLVILLVAWGFMTYTGLLLVEVNGWFSQQINLLSMSEEALGKKGRWTAWLSYLFLFYSILVAYTAASGSIFASILHSWFSVEVPASIASIFFTALFALFVYLGTRSVDLFNRALMAGLILTYFGMIGVGMFHINPGLLLHYAPQHILLSLPVLVIAFGFQNMIPSLTAYLKGNLQQVKLTIMGGSAIALIVYLVWSFLVLGILDVATIERSYANGEEATVALKSILGTSWITTLAEGFAFFAIITSFLAQGLTLTHFLADGFHLIPTKKNLWWLASLALAPPLCMALYKPQIFFRALSFAGGICAMVLFGILPVCMAWVGRYKRKHASQYHAFGGKTMLVIAFCFALFVIGCELIRFL